MKTKMKKLQVMILVMAIFITSISILNTGVETNAATGNVTLTGSTITTIYGDALKGSDGKVYTEYGFNSLNFNSGGKYTVSKTNDFTCKELIGVDNKGNKSWLYCVEYNTKFSRDGYSSSNSENSSYLMYNTGTLAKGLNKLASERNISNLYGNDSIRYILIATIYGWQPGANMPTELKNKGLNEWDWYFGTQVIIWELQQGIRQSPTQRNGNGYNAGDVLYKYVKDRPAEHAYNYVLSMMDQHKTIPSFSVDDIVNVPTYTMTWNSSNNRYETTLTDTNGYVFNLKFDNSDIKVSKSGNKYTIYTTKPISNSNGIMCSMSKDISIPANQKLLVWGIGGKQTMISGMQDPVKFYLSLKTVQPTVTINKSGTTAADKANKVFDVFLGNSTTPCLTLTTNASGAATGNLPGNGTYKIVERNTTNYNVTYTVNGSSTQTFTYPGNQFVNNNVVVNVNNDQKQGTMQIKKTSEDGFISGLTFRIESITTTGPIVDVTRTTDSSGSINISLYPGTYRVTEINTPNKYVTPAAQTVIIVKDKTATVSFVNTLKVPQLKIIKSSADGIVSGIKFNIKGTSTTGKAVDMTVTTGVDGSITSKIPQGTYTITELDVPSKYYTPESQTVNLINDETKIITFVNQLKPGYLQIKKTSEDNVIAGFKFRVQSISTLDGSTFDKIGYTDKDGYVTYDNYISINTLAKATASGKWETFRYIKIDAGITYGEMMDILGLDSSKYVIYQGYAGSGYAITNRNYVLSNSYSGGSTSAMSSLMYLYSLDTDSAYASIVLRGSIQSNKVTTADITAAKGYLGTNVLTYAPSSNVYYPYAYDIDGDNIITQTDINLMQAVFDDNGGNFPKVSKLTLSPGQYRITEIDPPDRYTAGYTSVVNITADNTSIVNVNNLLKTSGVRIIKESEDGIVEGIKFRIQGGSIDEIVTTESDGTIAKGLPLGTYTITEIEVPGRYVTPESKTVTISGSDYVKVTFKNVLKDGNVNIKKTSEDGIVEGFKFNIKSIYTYNGTSINVTRTTNNLGVIAENLPSGIYEITEQDIPERYTEQSKYTVVIKPGETAQINVVNKLKVPSFTIIKTAEDGIVDGVKFNVKGKAISGENIDITVATGNDGSITTEIPQGTYTFTEIEVPGKYITADPQTLTLVNDNHYDLSFENKLKSGELEIVKTSEDREIKDISFVITGVSDNGIIVNQTVKTNSEGKINITLLPGEYNVHEVLETNIYVPQQDQTVRVDYNKVASISFLNKLKKVNVNVIKKDAVNGVVQGDGTLQGAVYGLFKTAEDGEDILIEEFVTDENGKFSTGYFICDEGLYIKEISPSKGYQLDETIYKLSAAAADCVELQTVINLEVLEWPVLGNVNITKKMGTIENFVYEPGAVFEIYLKSAGSYENAKEGEKDLFVTDEATSAEESNIGETTGGQGGTKDLPYGTYILHQVSGTNGFFLQDDIQVEITEENTIIELELLNEVFVGSFKLTKVDKDDPTKHLQGAEYRIWGIDDHNSDFNEVFTTNKDGEIIIENLSYGKYKYQEVKAPDGYVLEDITGEFDIATDGELITRTATNKLVIGDFKLTKIDGENPEQHLQGAEYHIWGTDTYNSDFDEVFTTNENGEITIENLKYGKYKYQEVKAPDGYVLEDITGEFDIVTDGELITRTATNKLIKGTAKVIKRDSDTNNPVKGAKFGLFEEDGTELIIAYTDENGVVEFNDISYGKYYIQELEAPEGYLLNDEKHYFEIKEDGKVIEITAFNTLIEVPDIGVPEIPVTGDNNTIIPIIFLIFAGVIISVTIYKKRKIKD